MELEGHAFEGAGATIIFLTTFQVLALALQLLPLVHYSTESIDLNFFGKYDIHHYSSKPLSLTTLVQEDRKIP